ncbi:MAG: hypothetical protein ACK4KV_04470 [Rhodocyclaceae bacterium]
MDIQIQSQACLQFIGTIYTPVLDFQHQNENDPQEDMAMHKLMPLIHDALATLREVCADIALTA